MQKSASKCMRTAVTDISHQVFFLASFVGVTPAVLLDACAACRRALARSLAALRLCGCLLLAAGCCACMHCRRPPRSARSIPFAFVKVCSKKQKVKRVRPCSTSPRSYIGSLVSSLHSVVHGG